MLLQEHFFRQALREQNIEICKDFKINHNNGICINNNINYTVFFYFNMINIIQEIAIKKPKIIKYFYKGILTDKKNGF